RELASAAREEVARARAVLARRKAFRAQVREQLLASRGLNVQGELRASDAAGIRAATEQSIQRGISQRINDRPTRTRFYLTEQQIAQLQAALVDGKISIAAFRRILSG